MITPRLRIIVEYSMQACSKFEELSVLSSGELPTVSFCVRQTAIELDVMLIHKDRTIVPSYVRYDWSAVSRVESKQPDALHAQST